MSYDDFVDSQITVDAVIRNFKIVGEASNMLGEEFKLENPQVEWQKLTDFRNRLIHHSFGIRYDIVWDVINKEVFDYLDFLETTQ